MVKTRTALKWMVIGILLLLLMGNTLKADIPAEERAALIALYNATNGDNWDSKYGWKTPPLHTDGFGMPGTEDDWEGIRLDNVQPVSRVTGIYLVYNNLEGTLPAELGAFSALQSLNMNSNKLTGSIPSEIGNLENLVYVKLSHNELTGNIPPEIGNLVNLGDLSLRNNQLSGPIPAEIGNLINLEHLYLDDNQLSGDIPPELGNLAALRWLGMENNQLTGAIPPEFGNLSNMYHLDLNNNQLTSLPPEFCNLKALVNCTLDHNLLTGPIPPELGNMTQLNTISLNNNLFTGPIPPALGNLKYLYYLYLDNNQLTGPIPGELFSLDSYLRLWGNKLTGELPIEVLNFENHIDITYNGLYTDNPEIRVLLNDKNLGWEDTQTIMPANVSVLAVSTSAIKISWNPILYQGDSGGYEVYYSTSSVGPWTNAGRTANKSASEFFITGLTAGTRYYFRVRTLTEAHDNNANDVLSPFSNVVSAVTDSTLVICYLTVLSTPSSGVPITVTPNDNNGYNSGTTVFTRTYDKGATVTLTAPATYNGNYFLKWTTSTGEYLQRTLNVAMYDHNQVTAVYGQSNNVEVTVTTTADHVSGSLREAITNANAADKDITIILPAGTYSLYGAAKEDGNQSGDLDIRTDHTITIIGEGAEDTIIDGGKGDRVLDIIKGNISIYGVTIRNGETPLGADLCDGGHGGGIRNAGNLTLTKCTVKNNETGMGGMGSMFVIIGSPDDASGNGGNGGGIYSTGSLTLDKCTVENNLAGMGGEACYGIDGDGGHGGGIYSEGSLVLTGCYIRYNTAGKGGASGCDSNNGGSGGSGGGIYSSGKQTISKCRINYNTAGDGSYTEDGKPIKGGFGGGIYNSGENSSVTDTILENNNSGAIDYRGDGGCGGGIYNDGNFSLVKVSVNYNTAGNGYPGGYGGGIYNNNEMSITNSSISYNTAGDTYYYTNGGSGGGIYNNNSLTVKNSTVNNNQSGNGSRTYNESGVNGGDGGGICNSETGNTILENCTISANVTGKGNDASWNEGCGNGGHGGGIYNAKTITVTNCTIYNNQTNEGGTGDLGAEDGEPGDGGGIYNCTDNSTFKIKNTIVAGNKTAGSGQGPDCLGTLNSMGYNLIQNTQGCRLNGTSTGNITGVDPLLGPLTDNGGPTRTHDLLPDSPAIDTGESTDISIDQRGKQRPVDIAAIANTSDGSDIGAFEYDSPAQTTYTISGNVTLNGAPFIGVTLIFSNNGSAVTDENGDYALQVPAGWSGSVTPSKEGYVFTPASRDYPTVTADRTGQNFSAVNITPSDIVLNRKQLNFSANLSGKFTSPQTVLISSGTGVLSWTTSYSANWLTCTPAAGNGNGEITVSVDPAGLSEGTYTDAIIVTDPLAPNSPQSIAVTFTVYSTSAPPFGFFDTPINGSTVNGSIPVTGWVLDDVEVEGVRIYRGEGQESVYIGNAVCVEGARPDIEEAYPGYPDNYKAGWGYMLLTNALPNGGNGTFTLRAEARDVEGQTASLGTKTITCNNDDANEPFGAIDTPGQGRTVHGSGYVNWGWVLTPLPNTIPTDGSTINVWVDGVNIGHPNYDIYREDIATLFPGYNNSTGAVGNFTLDTTRYANGVHTIAWTATDDAGNSAGFGSRYFSIQNTSAGRDGTTWRSNPSWSPYPGGISNLTNIPVDQSSSVWVKRGYNPHANPMDVYPDHNGIITIEITELQRVEIRLVPETARGLAPLYATLPIGSTFDTEKGIFYWQPGPGFIGDYLFTFVLTRPDRTQLRKDIQVTILPDTK